MDVKGSKNLSPSNLATVSWTDRVYIAIRGSLHDNDCSVFGLSEEEIRALTKKYPGSGGVGNHVAIKTNVLDAINSIAQLGYKIVASSGETEITWTLQREV